MDSISNSHSHDDHLGITDAIYSFAQGLDLLDWRLWLGSLDEQVSIDYTSYPGGKKRHASPQRLTAKSWLGQIEGQFQGLDATQHLIANPRIRMHGDRASCTVAMRAMHMIQEEKGPSLYSIGGFYFDELRLVEDQWKLDSVRLQVTWITGDPHVMTVAQNRSTKRADRNPPLPTSTAASDRKTPELDSSLAD